MRDYKLDIEDRLGALASSAIFDSYNTTLRQVYKDVYEERTLVLYSTMDEQICEICKGLQGTKFDIEDANDLLPIHPYCRCSFITLKEAGE